MAGPHCDPRKGSMQDLWLAGTKWDEPIPPELERRWSGLMASLQEIESITIPRWLGTLSDSRLELHGFSDASERAYAASVYLVVRGENPTSNLLMAKTKVAPLKTLSMPRLELLGAHLLAQLLAGVRDSLSRDVKIFCWCDSQVVLSWLSDHPSKWTVFVATRTSDIHSLLPSVLWRHVSSAENPADIATRGSTPAVLRLNQLWWHGPGWLLEETPPKPLETKLKLEDLPEKHIKTSFFLIQVPDEGFISRFSSFRRLIRITAYCLRFVFASRRKEKPPSHVHLSAWELRRSREMLLRYVQGLHWGAEIKALKTGSAVARNSTLKTLRPFLDATELLRVGGRLVNASLSFSEKHPIIMPKRSFLTKLLIRDAHLQTLHGGPQLTSSYLMRSYWIIQGRSRIRSTIKECVRCARFSTRPQQQLMGSLPYSRVNPADAFSRAGVDYAGPVSIRMSKGRDNKSYKGYIAIFVCMVTCAVHLEAVSDGTSAAFIAAFRRFNARRGPCLQLTSDNGKNFHGAAAELRAMLQSALNQPEVATYLENDGTAWSFIPPGAPHFGGLWEAAVKSTKHHFRRVIGETTLTFEELTTLLTQVESCLNSRPLTAISEDPQDLVALTPSHFLKGSPSAVVPEFYSTETCNVGPTTRWLQLTHMRNEFWHRWSKEYLQSLQLRRKWKEPSPNLRVGDLVLIREANLPPRKWPLGRVVEIKPGADEFVRVVTIRTASSTLDRPVTKIHRLPAPTEDASLEDQYL